MKLKSKNDSYFTLITDEGRFLNFTSDHILTLYDLQKILNDLNLQYDKCYVIDPMTFIPVDLCIDINLKMPIPPHSRIISVTNDNFDLFSNFKITDQLNIPLSIIESPNGKFAISDTNVASVYKDIKRLDLVHNSDFHSKIKSVLKTMCQNQMDLNPDRSFFELARVSYQATLERRKSIENDPLLSSISICEPSNEFEHKKILLEVKVAFNAEEMNCLINQFVFQVNSDQYADEAIENLIKHKMQRYFPNEQLNVNDYMLQIPATDEIIAGHYPLSHFIFLQKYLESSKQTLKVNLIQAKSVYDPLNSKKGNISLLEDQRLYRSESVHSIDSIETYLHDYFSCVDNISNFESKCQPIKIPHNKIKANISFILEGIRFPKNNKQSYKIRAFLCVGTSAFQKVKVSKVLYELSYSAIGAKIDFKANISQLPRYSKIVIKLTNNNKKKNETFGYGSVALFDRYGKLQSGRIKMDFIFIKNVPNNPSPPPPPKSQVIAYLRFPSFAKPVYFEELKKSIDEVKPSHLINDAGNFENELKRMNISNSPLYKLTEEQKTFLINNRWKLISYPDYLPTFLRSFKRLNDELSSELPLLLEAWAEPDKSTAILLLSGEYYDPNIRHYVIKSLEKWNDADLSLFMLQIVRSLEVEHEDDSEIAKFLLRRASLEPKYIGLQLFWQLKSLFDIPWMHHRVLCMNAALVAFSDLHEKFLFSYTFTESLFRICNEKKIKQNKIGDELPMLPVDAYTQLPIDPKLIVKDYVISECFFADSSKRPLILSFKPADPFCNDNIKMMVKVNDDLRQDMITLQIMNVMDELWKREGLNMRMKLYSVLATGDNQGIIEIVPNSVTISSIQKKKGKLRGVRQNDTISEWLEKAVKAGIRKNEQIENFMYSMAGYIVATYVLGIGDRHCSNMMIQKDGHFFHIDFGHFLGHFKTFIGIDRESNMFYFSDAFVHVLGGVDSQTYKEFEALCCKAFCIIRKNNGILITLLYLMKNTGIPELSSIDDIKYVEKALKLDLSDDEACDKLRDMLKLVPTLKRTAVSDFCHQIQH